MKFFKAIALLLFCQTAQAQHQNAYVTFSIDSISVDSFYLRTRTITTVAGNSHKDTAITYTMFRDTSDFKAMIEGRYQDLASFSIRYLFIKEERDTLTNQYDRLVALGGAADSPFRFIEMPPGFTPKSDTPKKSETPTGFWVVYETGEAEYFYEVIDIKRSGTILYKDGTKNKITIPKAKNKPIKKQ